MNRVVTVLLCGLLLVGCESGNHQTIKPAEISEQDESLHEIETLIERLAISQDIASFTPTIAPFEPAGPTTQPGRSPRTPPPDWEARKAALDAVEQLRAYGRTAWPKLLQQVGDRRQSVCLRSEFPCSVGSACFNVVEGQIFLFPRGYTYCLCRRGLDGEYHVLPCTHRSGLYGDGTLTDWIKAREHKTLTEIHIETTEWLIAEEKKIGFPTEKDKEGSLYPLEQQFAKLKKVL